MFRGLSKNWCYLERIDLLFAILRSIFLAETITCVFFLRFFLHAIRTHVYFPCTKISIFLFYLLYFGFLLKQRRKTMFLIYILVQKKIKSIKNKFIKALSRVFVMASAYSLSS
jgi:hypothetical protein